MADLSAQVEAFLRNALRQKKLEDRLVRQALRDLRRTLIAIERVVGQSGVTAIGPARELAIQQVTAAVARSVQESFGVPQLAVLQEALTPFVEQQMDFARRMVTMAGGDLTQPAVAMTPMQASRMVNQAVVAGKTLEAQLTTGLPSMVADRVERYVRLGLGQAAGEVTTYKDAVVSVTERNVEALIRTGVHEVGSQAQGLIYEFETDPAWLGPDGLVWTAVLDSRVCPVCISLDGQRYEVGTPAAYFDGRNKVSPHPQCRCYLVPWKWRNEDMVNPDGERVPTKRPAEGDGGGTDALSFRVAARQWVRDNPETAQAIFGKRLGQQLVDGSISFDQAVRQWAS